MFGGQRISMVSVISLAYGGVRQRSVQYDNNYPTWLCPAGMSFKSLVGTRKVFEVLFACSYEYQKTAFNAKGIWCMAIWSK